MDIRSASDEQLLAEIERRKIAKTMPSPIPLEKPDFKKLIDTVTFGINEAIKNKYEDDDLRGYIYEAAIEAVYGPDYWKWRRAQIW